MVSPSLPNTRFLQRWRKKMPIGGQKAKRRSEFRRDSLHVFSQDHCWTVEEEVFEQSSLDIYNFWGNSVWFAKIQAGPFWFGHFVTVWQLYLFCYDDNKNSKYSLLLLVLLLCRRRMLLLGLRDPSFPYNTRRQPDERWRLEVEPPGVESPKCRHRCHRVGICSSIFYSFVLINKTLNSF